MNNSYKYQNEDFKTNNKKITEFLRLPNSSALHPKMVSDVS